MTQSKPQQPPRDHHFIAQFLLRAWRRADRKVPCYRRCADGRLRAKDLSPKSFGFEEWLYETTGLPPQHAQQMEQKFFEPLDTRASAAHRLLVEGRTRDLTDEITRDWVRFIMSIWFRTPSDVKGLGAIVKAFADPELRRRHLGMEEADELPDVAYHQLQMEAIRLAIDDAERGEALLSMRLCTLGLDEAHHLMVSDWPMQTAKDLPFLGHPGSYILMPVSPHRLFIAAPSDAFVHELAKVPQQELVLRVNHAVVAQARHFVGYSREDDLPFIKEHFACHPRPSIARTTANALGIKLPDGKVSNRDQARG
jgi:hypothetical protein